MLGKRINRNTPSGSPLTFTAEYKARQEREAAEYKAKSEASMKETAVTEVEMRETSDKWPYTIDQLHEYVESLVNRSHDYGTCCYAMSLAAVAAFNYVAHKLGVTGFQSSCADLDILRRTRHMEGPFMIIKAEDLLFPQSDPREELAEAIKDWQTWLKKEATKKLAETESAHPNVIAHWRRLAAR